MLPYLRGFMTRRWRSYLRLPPQVRRRHPLRCDGGARAARCRAADGGALSEEALLLLLLSFHLVPDEGEDNVAQLVDEVDVAAPRVILLLAALIRSLIDSVMVFLIPFLFCCYLGLCEFLEQMLSIFRVCWMVLVTVQIGKRRSQGLK